MTSNPNAQPGSLAGAISTPADSIERAAEDLLGDNYAGISPAADGFVAYTAGTPPPSVPAALANTPIHHVRYSLTQLKAFKADVDAAASAIAQRGIRLTTWGIDPATNSIAITVADHAEQAPAVIHEIAGAEIPLTIALGATVVT